MGVILKVVKHEDHWHANFVPDGERMPVGFSGGQCYGHETRRDALESLRGRLVDAFGDSKLLAEVDAELEKS